MAEKSAQAQKRADFMARQLTVFAVNALVAAMICYIFYQFVPSVSAAVAQYVVIMVLALRSARINELSIKTMMTIPSTYEPVTITFGKYKNYLRWHDADGQVTATLIAVKMQTAKFKAALSQPVETKILLPEHHGPVLAPNTVMGRIFSDKKNATTAIAINETGITAPTLSHQSLNPPGWLSVTNILILINSLYFLLASSFKLANMEHLPQYDLIRAGASLGVVDEPWRLLVSGFLHLSWWHLAFNMIALFWFGRIAEAKLGKLRYIGLYFFCLIGGAVASAAAFGGTAPSAGASGAIMGLGGFIVALAYWRRDLYRSNVVRQILLYVADIAIVSLLYGLLCSDLLGGAMTDNAGHSGGFVFGILGAWIFPHSNLKKRLLALLTSLILMASLWYVANQKYFVDGGHGPRAVLALSRGQEAKAREEFSQAFTFEKSIMAGSDKNAILDNPVFNIPLLKGFSKSLFGFNQKQKMADLYNSASWAETSAGHYAQGVFLADKSLACDHNEASLDTRAVGYMGLKNYAAARRDFTEALRLRPDYGATKYHMAQLNLLDPPINEPATDAARVGKKHERLDYDPEEWESRFGKP